MANSAISNITAGSGFNATQISDSETVVGLAIGAATEITVDHSADAEFSFCENPQVDAPAGVRITVLASGANNQNTTGAQFVLLVENVSYALDDYGAIRDIVISWTRKGTVA